MALFDTGYSAVTAFFVLSGFVLAYNYDFGALTAAAGRTRFAIARFSRIYPAYLAGLLLLVPLALYRLLSGIQIAPPAVEWRDFVLNVLLVQAWSPYSALTWNYPGWSLSNEAFFYAVFPVAGAWLWRMERPAALFGAMLALWALSSLAPGIAVSIPVHHWGDVAATQHTLPDDVSIWANLIRYNPLLRLPEFCAGIVLAKIYFTLKPQRHGPWLYATGGLASVLILSQAGRIPYPLVHNGLLLPLYALLIIGLAVGGGWPARWLSHPVLLLLGNASYAMYILHAPLYAWLDIFFRRALHREPSDMVWFFSYLAVVISVACLFFHFVEEPLHRRLRSALQQRLGQAR